MSGRLYNPKVENSTPSGRLVLPTDNLPKELKSSKDLTLDEIDARQVRIETACKKTYRYIRARITNKTIRVLYCPQHTVAVVKAVVLMAVEARRRLRHPDNQPFATPFEGIAWGQIDDMDGKADPKLVVTINGKQVEEVEFKDVQKKEETDAPGDGDQQANLIYPGVGA